MTLSDLRKAAVKKNLRIRFLLSNGMECVLNAQGVAQVPALHSVPGFNLENELAGVQEFTVEPAGTGVNEKSRKYTRDEIAALAAAGAQTSTGHDEHEE